MPSKLWWGGLVLALLLIAVTLFGCAQRICHPDDGECIEELRK